MTSNTILTSNTRYNNGKIYKIINNFNDMVYIGSTCLPLRKRIFNHKALTSTPSYSTSTRMVMTASDSTRIVRQAGLPIQALLHWHSVLLVTSRSRMMRARRPLHTYTNQVTSSTCPHL